MSHLMPEDVANAVMFALGTPPHVQVRNSNIKIDFIMLKDIYLFPKQWKLIALFYFTDL